MAAGKRSKGHKGASAKAAAKKTRGSKAAAGKKTMGKKAAAAKKSKQRGKSYSEIDVALIRDAYERNKWSAPEIVRQHKDKPWTPLAVKKILQKIKKGDPTGRKQGSGRKRSARPSPNVKKVENAPTKGGRKSSAASCRKIASNLKLHRSSVQRIIKRDLKLKSVAMISTTRLSEKQKAKRRAYCAETLGKLESGELQLSRVVFSDEKIFRCSSTSKLPALTTSVCL